MGSVIQPISHLTDQGARARELDAMTEAAIRTTNLTRDFGAVRAVDALTLEVPPGLIFGFLGANGAGKTTTINLLLGLLEPTAGQAQVLGFDTRAQGSAIRERAGALLEFSGLYERLTAEDNLDFYGRVWRLSAAERQARIRELLTHIGLYDRRKERVGSWSRGMKQKLAIARVLLHWPALIFLDEPTAGLDPVAAAALRDDLEGLVTREGVTVFLNTHNLPEAERLCQQVGVIRSGKLLAVGSPDELRQRTGRPEAEVYGDGFTAEVLASLRARRDIASAQVENGRLFLELSDQQAKMAPIITALVEVGVQIEEVRRSQASLEDVFLSLMEEDSAQEVAR
jgi:ABC-2 type transport system ATP-binding protein